MIVVLANRSELYSKLRRNFERAGRVEVVVDRRRGDRRQRSSPVERDWRLSDRRNGAGESQATAYRLAQRGDGFEVYEAAGPVRTRCPDCGVTVRCEMPRFAEPPSRLELDVVHEINHARYARHFAELRAFTATGRLLLSYRTMARVRAEPAR